MWCANDAMRRDEIWGWMRLCWVKARDRSGCKACLIAGGEGMRYGEIIRGPKGKMMLDLNGGAVEGKERCHCMRTGGG